MVHVTHHGPMHHWEVITLVENHITLLKKPETPSPTTPSPKGENTCEICGKKTQDHSTEELKNCIAKSINKSITKTTWFR